MCISLTIRVNIYLIRRNDILAISLFNVTVICLSVFFPMSYVVV